MLSLPWPPKELSPNARVHWAVKWGAAKEYRRICYLLTLQSKIQAPEGRALLILKFCPPDRRSRDDDNLVSAFKSGRDGIAQALRIDDNRFDLRVERGEPVKHGAVEVTIQSQEARLAGRGEQEIAA